MSWRVGCVCWLLAASTGCDRSAGPSADLVADATDLQRAVTNDRELAALVEVEDAVADDLPVRAAELLRIGAIPAARRHVTEVAELTMRTAEGRRHHRRAMSLLDKRVDSLQLYHDALERGLIEDVQLLEAIRAQREAEEAIDAYLGVLEELHPLPSSEQPDEAR